jgi:hypothetical protein
MPCNCTTGAGSPEGVLTGAVGDQYVQSNGQNGQTLWRKRFATAGSPPVATKGWGLMQGSLDVFNVKDYGAVGNGTTDDTTAIQNALTAAQAANGLLVFPAATYAFSQTLNFGPENLNGFSVLGVGGEVTLLHTGSGTAVQVNGNTVSNQTFRRSWNIRVENITVRGNNNTTIGFLFRHTHHGIFRNLRVMSGSATGTAFKLEWTVLNLYENLVCTANEENGAATLPKFGIVITVGGANTQGNTFINPIIEGLDAAGAIGIHIIDGARNWFYGGSSEANTKNIQVDNPCTGNAFNGIYLEDAKASPPIHVTDNGRWTHWVNCLADGFNSANFDIGATAVHTVIEGGQIVNLRILAGATDTFVSGVTSTAVSDGGTRTVYFGLYDEDAAVFANTKIASRLDFNPDSTHDIAQSGAGRPRDIFVGRQLILQGAAPALRVNTTVANGTVATTLGSTGPSGSTAGAPRGWMPVSINGTTRYIPFW